MLGSERRRAAIGEWLREVSALVLVFPIVDQLVREQPATRFDCVVGGGGVILGLILLALGLPSKEEQTP